MPAPERPRSLSDRRALATDVEGAGRYGRAGKDRMLENIPWSLVTEQVGSEITLRVSGALDLDTSAQLRAAGATAFRHAESAPSLTVDLAEVTFVDSTGLGVLVTLWHEARNVGGKFRVARPSPAATRILEITGVDTLFDVT